MASDVNDVINGLSSDELDMLHSDPKMFNDFKAKYSPNTSGNVAQAHSTMLDNLSTVGKSVLGAVSPELTTAVQAATTPEVSKPIQDAMSLPMRGLRGLGTLPEGLTKATEAISPTFHPETGIEKTADVAATLADPRAAFMGPVLGEMFSGAAKLGAPAMKQAARFAENMTGVDSNSFRELAADPIKILNATDSKTTGKAFQAAKESAGVGDAENRALALSDGMRKKVYRTVMDKIDAYIKGPESAGKSLEAGDLRQLWGKTAQEQTGLGPEEIAHYTRPDVFTGTSPISKPLPSDISVADLLKAKKAGQMIASKQPEAAGLIGSEISNKINPLLKQMAPDVYETQQANHLSHVKESFMSLFPKNGFGLHKSAEGYALYHFLGPKALGLFAALNSPIVTGAATVAGSAAAKAATSPLGRQVIAAQALKGLNTLGSNSALQSVRDKLNVNNQ